ncbi:hypothetical protein AQUCO_00900579v1, partial [Aquilegia coerulea]
MDKLVSLEPSNIVAIRVEPGRKCYGVLTLRNVMHTMPVAFQLLPIGINKTCYITRPRSEIVYLLPSGSMLPDSFPHSDDSFILHSVVVPGVVVKDPSLTYDTIPSDWFAPRKKQVFYDSGIKVVFVGSSILAQLVANGSSEEVREVLEKSNPEWRASDSVDAHGQTLLHLAIAQGRADLVQLLLEYEPDVEARSRYGQSALEAAVAAGELLIVELLLAHESSTGRYKLLKWGSIHLAARGGYVEIMRLLLLKGAESNALTGDGQTALHIAVEENHGDCIRLLLDNGATANLCNTGNCDTPLHIAARLGDEDTVKLLLEKGANKEIRNQLGKTAYDLAAEHGHNRLFDVLRFGDSLYTAARKGEARTINWLLENGASINGVDQHGWTALHRAAFKGQVNAVRAILSKGADIDAKDSDGYTALHCATESGQAEVIELLLRSGADVEAKTNKGVVALQMAYSLQYSGITRIL